MVNRLRSGTRTAALFAFDRRRGVGTLVGCAVFVFSLRSVSADGVSAAPGRCGCGHRRVVYLDAVSGEYVGCVGR